MARRNPPGWYPTEDGGTREWDGQAWTGRKRPAPPRDSHIVGWHVESKGIFRWWTGTHWSEARAAADGHVDVSKNIGQTVLNHTMLGGADAQVIAMLMDDLRSFPPSRIEQIQTYTSAIAVGTSLIAVVSWPSPTV